MNRDTLIKPLEKVAPIVTHWSVEPMALPLWTVSQSGGAPPGKPCGLWLSDESDFGWREWCKGEDWNLGALAHRTDFTLDLTGILHLSTMKDLLRFTRKYQLAEVNTLHRFTLDWPAVAAEYDGIFISPYCHEARFDLSWYYGWDCASACIWQPRCLTRHEP